MPTFVDLPDETILDIFLEPLLDYKDLKRISRTCKKLHRLEQDESLDLELFRKGLPPPPSSNNDDEKVVLCKKGVKVNLIADASGLSGSRADGDRESGEATSGDPRKYADIVVKVHSLKCVNELATSPPCRRLCWAFCGVAEATNDAGVTVRDAIEALVAMWGSSVDGDSEDSGEEDVCWLETLGDHRFWEGISSSSCSVDDEVLVGAQFGS